MGRDPERPKPRSLGRDVFNEAPKGKGSGAVRKILTSTTAPEDGPAQPIEVNCCLTPYEISHLDGLRAELKRQGREFTRDELIRLAIVLLSLGDV